MIFKEEFSVEHFICLDQFKSIVNYINLTHFPLDFDLVDDYLVCSKELYNSLFLMVILYKK